MSKTLGIESLTSLIEVDEFIYHYTKSRTLADIIYSKSIRLNSYRSTNDPRESKDLSIEVINGDLEPMEGEIECYQQLANRYMKDSVGLACFSRDSYPETGFKDGDPPFFRGWEKARMWSQYAEGHTGACLVFSCTDLCDKVRFYPGTSGPTTEHPHFPLSSRVTYENSVPQIQVDLKSLREDTTGALYQALESNIGQLYFKKYSDWESEQEFRIVQVRSGQPFPMHVCFGETLKAIIVGEAFLESELMILPVRLEKYGLQDVEIFKCSWDNLSPVLEVFREPNFRSVDFL